MVLLYKVLIITSNKKALFKRVNKVSVVLLILIYRYLELIKFNILAIREYDSYQIKETIYNE